MNDMLYIILLIAAGQGVFLSVLLVTDKNKKANALLGFIFLFLSILLLDFILLYSGTALDYPYLAFWSTPFNLAFGPLLYLYISKSDISSLEDKKLELLHYGPFALYFIYHLFTYHFLDNEEKRQLILGLLSTQSGIGSNKATLISILPAALMYLQLGIYIWLSHMKLLQKKNFGHEVRSWLLKVWYAIIVIGCFGLVQSIFLVLGIDYRPATGYLAATLALFYIYYGAILFFKKPKGLFINDKPKYQYSKLRPEDEDKFLADIQEYMDKNQPYLNPEFGLKDLSNNLKLPERHISQAINAALGKNFSDFLNDYRLEEFKSELLDQKNAHLSILGIALNSGFNSKSTFNTVFKRRMGITPSEYKKQIQ